MNKTNNLEHKIFQALLKYEGVEKDENPMIVSICRGHAETAAKIALELAQDAYDQGRADQAEYEVGQGNSTFKRFIKNYD